MTDVSSRPPTKRRRVLRRMLLAVGVVLLAVLVLGVLAVLALRSADTRRALITRATNAIRDTTGLEVTAADATVDFRGRRLTLERVAIAAEGEQNRPFLTLDRVVAVVDAGSLVRAPLRILELEAQGARLDLSAPLPEALTSSADSGASAVPELEHFVVDGLTIVSVPLPETAAARLGEVRVEDVRAAGSIRGGRIELAVDRGELSASGRAPAQGIRASVAGRAAGPLQGPYELDEIRLAGDGISVEGEGTLGLAESDPLHFRGNVEAEPGRLFPEAGAGRVSMAADLDVRGVAGTIEAQGTALPAELLESALGADIFASLGAAGTFLDGDLRLRLAGRDRVAGSAHLLWREDDSESQLLVADLATVGEMAVPTAPIEVDVEAQLVPVWSGRRTVRARLRLPSFEQLTEMEIVTGRAEVVTADVARTLADVEARFPGLMPALPAGWPIAGPLTLAADARGPLLDPEVDLDAEWRPQPQTSIVLRGGGRPNRAGGAGPKLAGRATVDGLDLATIEPLRETIAAGVVNGVVDLDVDGSAIRAHTTVSSRDLELVAADRRIDALDLEATFTRGDAASTSAVRIVRATAVSGETRVEASGDLDLDLRSARPLLAATIDAVLVDPIEDVDRVEARLVLDDGTLRVDVPAATTDYGAMSGRATVPLAALASIPALSEAIASLPTAAANGPIELTLKAPDLEAAALLRRLEIEGPDMLRGAVDLALTANLDQPAASVGVLAVRNLAISAEDAALATRAPIDLRLASGRLTLQPVTIVLHREAVADEPSNGDAAEATPEDLELEIGGWAEVAHAWKIGDPFGELLGPLRVEAAAQELDGAALFAALGIDPPFESMSLTGSELQVALDPADPAAATAHLTVAALDAVLQEGHTLRLTRPLALRVADRALELEPAEIQIDSQTLTVAGGARFDADWRPDRPATELISALDASVRGVLEMEALAPYFAGASTSGRLALDVEVKGTLEELAGHASIVPGEGGVEIVLLDPYYTHVSDPRIDLSMAGGKVTIESATATLNEGTIRLTGGAVPSAGTLDVEVTLDEVRYRLDYGLLTENEAWLRLTRSPEGALRLAGRIWMERGVLRRDLDPDREVLSYFFAPEEIDEAGLLDDLELDLELATVDGVRIRNNLADLRASWAPLEITGTLAAPLIDGTIDVDPGGYLFAFGQTVRIDSAEIDFAGDGSPATIDLESTTSWEDPTVAQVGPEGQGGFLDSLLGTDDDEKAEIDEAIARGFAGYYGERVARRLSESLGGVEVSLRPILIFGLDNPGTEVTVSRDLSPQVTAAVSVSLREEGRQTYIADVHEIDTLPRFVGQLYTLQTEPQGTSGGGSVESVEGVVVQQRLLFGGTRVDEADGPRLRHLVLQQEPKVLSKRAVKRRLGFESGEALADGAAFEAQIEILEVLRRHGYPGADVDVTVVPVAAGDNGRKRERADLQIAIEPGQRVRFEFRGVELHRRQRELITAIYRPDFLERVSLDEMREQTLRGLHSEGFLDPEVSIDVFPTGSETDSGPATDDEDRADRVVVIDARASRPVQPSAPRIEGIDADAEAAIAARFVTTLSRVELALGEPAADRRLTTALLEYGYPEARVVSRSLEPLSAPGDSRGESSRGQEEVRPVIAVSVPERQHVAAVSIVGRLEGASTGADGREARATPELVELDGLADLLRLEAVRALEGEPVRADSISSAAFAIEDALHARGHARVRVRSRLVPLDESRDGSGMVLRYELDRADAYRVDAIAFEGLRSTRSEWARDVADLEPGAELDPEALRAARRRLYETGLFSSVLPEIDYGGGATDSAAEGAVGLLGVEPRDAGVTFSVRERPRFELAYGILWQSDLGAGAVIDAVDQNLFGRGLTLGARALYREDDRSGRIYSAIPRVLGTRGSLQLFAEYSEHEDTDELFLVDNESFEINVTAAMPLRRNLTGRLYARYLDITDSFVDPDPVFPIPPFEIAFSWPSLGFQAVYEGRDDPVTTQRGTFASVDVSGADETVGSDFSYARLFTRASHHRELELFSRPVVWAQSARLGLARAFREQELLSFEHLFAGGEYSIRGYDEESIGPDILDRVEEQVLLVLNEELHVPVWRDLLTGVLFVDAGNVWDDLGRLGDNFLTAVGLGLRAATPVGLVRLDVAYPLDQLRGEEQKVKVYFGLGNVF